MNWEQIENRLNLITPYALYVSIQTGLNIRMDHDNMYLVGRHPIKCFDEFTAAEADHYNYIRKSIKSEINRIEEKINRIKNHKEIEKREQERWKKLQDESPYQCTCGRCWGSFTKKFIPEYNTKEFAGWGEVLRRFFKYGTIQLYWYSK